MTIALLTNECKTINKRNGEDLKEIGARVGWQHTLDEWKHAKTSQKRMNCAVHGKLKFVIEPKVW